MERKIKVGDLQSAVFEAYEKFKSEKEGVIDGKLKNVKADLFGISVVINDGTVIEKGDTATAVELGNISQLAVATVLLQQLDVKELLKKSGICSCHNAPVDKEAHHALKHSPIKPRIVRAVSAVEPANDPDGKMDILTDNLNNMIGGTTEFGDDVYKELKSQIAESKEEETIAKAGYYLYDDAALSLDVAARLQSLKLTTTQLATLGATVVADGVNPVTKQVVFDGSISERLIAMMATFGPAKHTHGWLISSGAPALASFSGGMLAVIPGVLSIAAYSPLLNEKGVSIKASHAIRYILNKLQINTFASAKVVIEK